MTIQCGNINLIQEGINVRLVSLSYVRNIVLIVRIA